MCSIERSDVYLVNGSSKLESVNRVHEIGEKSHSLLDHPRKQATSLAGFDAPPIDVASRSHDLMFFIGKITAQFHVF